jgi:hypothetical protein
VAVAASGEDTLLFRVTAGILIDDGGFGAIAGLQTELIRQSSMCHVSPNTSTDGKLGWHTLKLLRQLAQCAGGPPGRNVNGDSNAVTESVWRRSAPGVEPPDASQRAFIMTTSIEGTNYARIEFDVGTSDPGILTWGPLGATAGQQHEVQQILQRIDRQDPTLIGAAFYAEEAAVRSFFELRTSPAITTLIGAIQDDPKRRVAWEQGFRRLVNNEKVRAIYDQQMRPVGIAFFYRSYWAHCWQPTEVDFGFFLDRVVQTAVSQDKTDRALHAVAAIEQRLGPPFSPAERRRAIAANFAAGSPEWVGDRLARDVAYYVDDIPEASLTDPALKNLRENPIIPAELNSERARWLRRFKGAAVRASDFGLSDTRPGAVPDDLIGKAPACVSR